MIDGSAALDSPDKSINNNKVPRSMNADTGVILRADKVSKSVDGPDGRLSILDGVSLALERGASLAIVGASGSGKTTLLGLLAGLDTPTSGAVFLSGERLDTLDEEARARRRRKQVGFVFQSFHLLPALDAIENVMLPLELDGADDARGQAKKALAEVGLGQRLHHYPHQLSGGEQQRVALARAFVHGPSLLFADEPTGNLDQRTGTHVTDLLFGLNREHGTTLVLVSHDQRVAERCGASITLREGKIIEPVE